MRLTVLATGQMTASRFRQNDVFAAPAIGDALAMTLIHCIYASSATTALREEQIPALLERARQKNVEASITGMLLFIEGSFFQVLEGDSATVDRVYEAIAGDGRHERVTQIIREPIAKRSFGEWSMGFASLERADAQRLVGENDFFGSAACLEGIDRGRTKKLLVAFREGRWRTEQTGVHRARARAV